MLHTLVEWLVQTIGALGYTGVLVLMFLESSFFPFPSEVVVPPAAYLAARGEMNLALVIAAGTLGSLLGGLFNYFLAVRFGRPFFERWGRYLFVSAATLDRAEEFFARHGHISTFVGRLIPGVRQYISLPAGIARMHLGLFSLFTSLGAGIWVLVLALGGYWLGRNPELLDQFLHQAVLASLGACALLVGAYWLWRRARRASDSSRENRQPQ